MPNLRQVFFKPTNVSLARRPASERVPPLILRRVTYSPQGVTERFKGKQDKDSSQMNPKEIEWLWQPLKTSKCYHHSIRPVYKPA